MTMQGRRQGELPLQDSLEARSSAISDSDEEITATAYQLMSMQERQQGELPLQD
jgi:hypothetical protein